MKSPYELFHIECGEGWKELYEPLIKQCQEEGVTILQIKEKFGGLRFYTAGESEELYKKICEAEDKSYEICEECGKPGKRRNSAWIRTLCDYHAGEEI